MKDSVVARRYAKSLVKSASDENELRTLLEEFRICVKPLTEDGVMSIWSNPGISVERKMKFAEDIVLHLETSKRFASFLHVLAEKNRIKLLDLIYEEFVFIARKELGEVMVFVETAFDLTEVEKNDLSSILRRKLGKKIILEMVLLREEDNLMKAPQFRI